MKRTFNLHTFIFGSAILISATLLFWIQPLFTKKVLPILGGAPNVWNVAMVCFQALLLGGYWYADRLTRLCSKQMQAIIHAIVICSATAWMLLAPANLTHIQSAYSTPVAWLLSTLLLQIGLIFFMLATTSTLMQRWYSELKSGDDVYWLYIISNTGSMLGVFGFIGLIEPFFGLSEQSSLFKVSFTILAALLLCATLTYASKSKKIEIVEAIPSIPLKQKIRWLLLAAVPSSFLLSATTHITTDIAPVPLVWMLLLGLYLISFIVAFSTWKRLTLKTVLKLQATICIPLIADFFLDMAASGGISIMIWHMLAFFVTAVVCHRLMYESRPPAAALTTFYLYMSIGGAVGGIFTSLIAPVIFNSLLEYPLAVVLAFALRPATLPLSQTWKRDILIGAAVLLVLIACMLALKPILNPYRNPAGGLLMMIGFFALKFCFDQEHKPFRLACCFAATIIAGIVLADLRGRVVERERNFYGIITVDGSEADVYSMRHGTTVHGRQYIDNKEKQMTPLTYFHPSGPLGDFIRPLIESKENLKVAAIGLGVGSVACYGKPGDKFVFFEINPTVIKLANDKRYFSYLSNCPPSSTVVEGDARISIEQSTEQYDFLILDAFTSDAIPMHLLTKEAFDVYWNKIKPGGAIITHISNRYLDLAPVLKAIADDRGMDLKVMSDKHKSQERYKSVSMWTIMATKETMDKLDIPTPDLPEKKFETPTGTPDKLWTDDYSNILRVLKLF